jgi:hypothetical protein
MFGLDPQSIAERVKASGQSPCVPTLRESVLRGTIGFTLVSLGGFAPWTFASRWLHRTIGETGMYATCAIVFVGLSGLLLHRLIIGSGSLARFYEIFSFAFIIYAIGWTVGWMALRGHTGSIVGLLAGTAAMGAVLAHGFGARDAALKIIAALFIANAAGYFVGQWAHDAALALKEGNALGIVLEKSTRATLSKAVWGLFYGLGFGAGIGFAFHACQDKARKRIAREIPSERQGRPDERPVRL